ncbi:MAG: amidohydrolase [Desulfovibrionaceae bacterium]|nr:amidohydrolase [Desulfovibrionaceae bacterium]
MMNSGVSNKKPCDIICSALYTSSGGNASVFCKNFSLAIAGGVIADVGPRESIEARWEADTVRDFGKALIIPGLVNAHTHVAMTYMRGFADDLPLLTWLTKKIFPVEAQLTERIVRVFSLLGFAEMLASGTTSCLDMYLIEKAAFDAAKTAGIRFHGGEGIFAFPSPGCATFEEGLEKTESLAKEYADNPRLAVTVNPHSVYTTNPTILKACVATADKLNLPIHIHLAETPQETKECEQRFGARPIALCDKCDLFSQKVTAAHMVDISSQEMDFIAKQKDTVVVTNPTSNMKLASGVAKIPEMRSRSIPLALGTDGPASNNTLNMFSAMRHTALIHKLVKSDPECLSAETAFCMATLGGARALHRDDIASLAKGMQADLAVLDLTAPNLVPLYSPTSHIVYAASGHEVLCTMVGGEICYENGRYTRFSYEDLLTEAWEISADLKKMSSLS